MKSEPSDFRQLMNLAGQRRTLVVVFANSEYHAVLDRWLAAIGELKIQNYVVIALDQAICEAMTQRGIVTLYRPCPAKQVLLWPHRADVLLELLSAGFNLVHSDADAIWRKNPLEDYIYDKGYDLIFSPGTSCPQDVYNKWGFVLCCGFFHVLSNAATLEFFCELVQALRTDPDDQRCMNRLLLKRGLVWNSQDSYGLEIKGKSVRYFTEPTAGDASGLRVCVLPHAQFQRLPVAENDLYIQHWLSKKTAISKLEIIDK